VIPRVALARPTTIDEAFTAFAAAGGDAAWYAGGTELLQVMKMGLARFSTLIDLKRLPELRGIAVDGGELVIGGGVTHREIERNEVVRRVAPALAELEAHVANVRVRNQGTIGGNLCFAEPHSDPATFLLACNARVRLASPRGTRELPIGEFILDPLVTARDEDEILVSVVVPRVAAGEGRAYEKAKFRERPAVSVAVRLRADGGKVVDAHVAVGSMTDRPMLVPDAAAALVGMPVDRPDDGSAFAPAIAALGDLDAVGDLDGSPDYKRHLAGVLLGRATRAARAEATAGA
jgi:aerobic carbon-monoxide dehydrogenase medium subunit